MKKDNFFTRLRKWFIQYGKVEVTVKEGIRRNYFTTEELVKHNIITPEEVPEVEWEVLLADISELRRGLRDKLKEKRRILRERRCDYGRYSS